MGLLSIQFQIVTISGAIIVTLGAVNTCMRTASGTFSAILILVVLCLLGGGVGVGFVYDLSRAGGG